MVLSSFFLGFSKVGFGLQEYLSEAKEGGTFGGIAGVPYRFVFYLHQKPESQPKRISTSLTEEGQPLKLLPHPD